MRLPQGLTCEEMSLTAQYMIWYYEADIVLEIAGELLLMMKETIVLFFFACQTAGEQIGLCFGWSDTLRDMMIPLPG